MTQETAIPVWKRVYAGAVNRSWAAAQRHPLRLIAFTTLVGIALMLAVEVEQIGRLGFPLDDAWIHARFAQNLADGHGWSYNPGEPVPGSTSPLWVIVTAALIKLTGTVVAPMKLAGITLLVMAGLLAWALTRAQGWTWQGDSRTPALLAGLLIASAARLSWGAVSGMEIALVLSLSLGGMLAHVGRLGRTGWSQYLGTVMFALAALSRPECYVLMPIALLDRLLAAPRRQRWREVARWPVHVLIYASILAPNWLFNLTTIGSPFPATFAAKTQGQTLQLLVAGQWLVALQQAVRGSLNYSRTFLGFLMENNLPLIVPAVFGLIDALALSPSAKAGAASTQPRSRIVPLTLILYPPIVGALFATQFFGEAVVGRYMSHVLAVYLLIAAWGIWPLSSFLARRLGRRPVELWAKRIAAVVAGLAILYAAGAQVIAAVRHGWMVYDIENMHVAMGHWVRDNTPESAVVALNDIGAITYFSDRRIIDIVGLVTPKIVPYLHQSGKTLDQGVYEYLSTQRPDYLLAFPNWYPELVARPDFTPVYTRTVTPNVTMGGDTMVVYKTRWP